MASLLLLVLLGAPSIGLPLAAEAQDPAPESAQQPGEAEPAAAIGAEEVGDGGGAQALEDEEGRAPEGEVSSEEAESSSEEEGPPPADHITFTLPLPEERGGGVLTGSAGSIEYEGADRVRLTQGVELRFQDIRIQGQSLSADLKTEIVFAEGEVILDQGPRRVVAETLEFDLQTKTAVFTNATAYVDPDFFFSGEEIRKVGEDLYTLKHGTFTSCTEPTPDWSVRVSSARIQVDGFARAKNVRIRAKKLPLLYTPYILWPAKNDRTSGFLIPNIGYGERRGAYLGLAYFQTLGRSADATLYADLWEKEYYGFGAELRYVPSETTEGNFEGYIVDDPTDDDTRWKVKWKHIADRLPWGFRGVLSINDYSDFEYFRDFERDFNDVSLRSVYSSAYISKNLGASSFNLLVDDRETIVNSGNTVVQRQLPEVEYRLRQTQVGGLPLYFELESSLHYLENSRSEALDSTYGRTDWYPRLTVPLSTAPWLSLSVTGGARYTWYEDSLNEDGKAYSGDSLDRLLPIGSIDIVGPSFSRIFEKGAGGFAKFKHIVEPRWSYNFTDDFNEANQVPLFDQIDDIRSRNLGSFSLVNRLLAKPKDVLGEGDAREILSFTLTQQYSFDQDKPLERSADREEESQLGPLSSRLRFNPSERTSLDVSAEWSNLFNAIASTSLSGTYSWGPSSVGVTWFTRHNAELRETRSNQVRFFSTLDFLRGRWGLDAQINYDFQLQEFQQQRYVARYNSDCWGLRLEVQDLNLGQQGNALEYRFALSLKNVGTFIDLSGGDRASGR